MRTPDDPAFWTDFEREAWQAAARIAVCLLLVAALLYMVAR